MKILDLIQFSNYQIPSLSNSKITELDSFRSCRPWKVIANTHYYRQHAHNEYNYRKLRYPIVFNLKMTQFENDTIW